MGKLTSTAHEGAVARHEPVHANPGARRDRGCVCRGSVGIALLVGPRRYNRSKLEAYECGIEPVPELASAHAAGQRFPIKYYLTAMLFIVFDIEIVFLYPWAVAFDSLGLFALVEMLLFMVVVFVAYAYVWRRGGLNWD